MKSRNFLIGLTGSIACYKACALISRLVGEGHNCKAIATSSALKFVGLATLEGLTRQTVHTKTFSKNNMMSHIDLARWADVFIVAPATANFINKMHFGWGDDLLSTTLLAYEAHKQLWIAPAMNSVMLAHPSVQNSLHQLESRGVQILLGESGRLACGEEGYGKMAEPDAIFNAVMADLDRQSTKNQRAPQRVLLTFGGTSEPIDGVRRITNLSTGRTGAELADHLTSLGYQTDCLMAQNSARPKKTKNWHFFESFLDLEKSLSRLLRKNHYDLVVHLAAVSDYSVDRIESGHVSHKPHKTTKLPSEKPITLHLKTNKKLVTQLKTWSKNKKIKVLAFKLTNSKSSKLIRNAVEKLLAQGPIDWVAHNDLNEITATKAGHPFHIYNQSGHLADVANTHELALNIHKNLSEGYHGTLS